MRLFRVELALVVTMMASAGTAISAAETTGVRTPDACFFETLTSAEWFVFGAPEGEVSLRSKRLWLKADGAFGVGGSVGAIWRKAIHRPAKGLRYLHVWRIQDATLARPGRACLVLKARSDQLTPLGKDDHFGILFEVSPKGRRVARLVRQGEITGYHLLPGSGSVDVRFTVGPQSLRVELKSSDRDEWVRLPVVDNPWDNDAHKALYLHIETYGDPDGRHSSHYSVAGIELSETGRAQPSRPIAADLE